MLKWVSTGRAGERKSSDGYGGLLIRYDRRSKKYWLYRDKFGQPLSTLGSFDTREEAERAAEPKSNPTVKGFSVFARRRGNKGEWMWFDGKKFTNNHKPKVFGTRERAKSAAMAVMLKFPVLNDYKVYVGAAPRFRNPSERSVDRAARKLEAFTGFPARKIEKFSSRSDQRAGLVVGKIAHLSYIAQRRDVPGVPSTPVEYEHTFSKASRPLLAVTTDGKQLHIVGGRYEFTEAGIEDR